MLSIKSPWGFHDRDAIAFGDLGHDEVQKDGRLPAPVVPITAECFAVSYFDGFVPALPRRPIEAMGVFIKRTSVPSPSAPARNLRNQLAAGRIPQ